MSKVTLNLETESFNQLFEAIQTYQDDARNIINEVFWDEGGALINEKIMQLLPESGRKWKGKKPAAKRSAPFTQVNENLSVTVKTKNAYHYLYFPDDGSSTRKHAGQQDFMYGGAIASQSDIINRCVGRLVEKFEQ